MTSARAAFFDVDGTLVRSNIVRTYVHFRTRALGRLGRALWIAGYLPQVARWLLLDAVDRRRMNRAFYAGYAGLEAAPLRREAREAYPGLLARRLFPAARARVEEHRRRGDRIVLLTGSLDFIIEPLRADLGADDLIASGLEERDGRFTGRLLSPPLAGEEKARAAREHARRHGLDLELSFAYGDSASDLELLAAVGHPVAVNPDRALARVARARGWPVERWQG